MTRRLEGKTALVIGAGSVGPGWGNGKATAVLFAREGANVLCVDLNEALRRRQWRSSAVRGDRPSRCMRTRQ